MWTLNGLIGLRLTFPKPVGSFVLPVGILKFQKAIVYKLSLMNPRVKGWLESSSHLTRLESFHYDK